MPSPATQHRGAAGRPSVSKEMRGKLPRRRGGALLFHLISQLYEKTSLIVTPNLYPSRRGGAFLAPPRDDNCLARSRRTLLRTSKTSLMIGRFARTRLNGCSPAKRFSLSARSVRSIPDVAGHQQRDLWSVDNTRGRRTEEGIFHLHAGQIFQFIVDIMIGMRNGEKIAAEKLPVVDADIGKSKADRSNGRPSPIVTRCRRPNCGPRSPALPRTNSISFPAFAGV